MQGTKLVIRGIFPRAALGSALLQNFRMVLTSHLPAPADVGALGIEYLRRGIPYQHYLR